MRHQVWTNQKWSSWEMHLLQVPSHLDTLALSVVSTVPIRKDFSRTLPSIQIRHPKNQEAY